MSQESVVAEIAKELGIPLNEHAIELIIKILDAGMPVDNMVKLIEEIKNELNTIEKTIQ